MTPRVTTRLRVSLVCRHAPIYMDTDEKMDPFC